MVAYLTCPQLEHAGRLGNQLWQIAGTIGLARKHGYEPRFPDRWSYRPFFSIPDEMFDDVSGARSMDLVTHMDRDAAQYLQDYSLFSEVEDEIRRVFAPSDDAKVVLFGSPFANVRSPVLSIHVRRGDNVFDPGVPDKHRFMPLIPTEWYLEAADELRDVATVACFSDDPGWCRENIPADFYGSGSARPKDGTPEYWTARVLDWIDLFHMAHSEYHVCSASSYAWWGAFLSGDPSPIIPSPWYGPALAHLKPELMIPPGWRVKCY